MTTAVTMQDVAARAGVSRALVSIVFRDAPGASAATRERVLAAAAELGYRPDPHARLLGRKRSRTIGVVFGLPLEFHGQVVDQLYTACDTTDYEIVLGAATPAHSEARAVQTLVDYRVEALVLVGPTLSRAAVAELTRRTPTVVVARSFRGSPVDVVRTDDVAGAWLATEHLLSLGHGPVVHVDGGSAPGAAERRRGYHRAMCEAGLSGAEVMVPGGVTDADGERAARTWMALRPRPSGVAAFNDHCAAGLVATARAEGLRVPGDLSVTGFDDSPIAALSTLSLTTVAQDARALAQLALGRAVVRANGAQEPPQQLLVAPRLVRRATTDPALPHLRSRRARRRPPRTA